MSDQETLMMLARRNDYRTSHVLHLLLSILTVGIWVPVWLLVTLSNAIERRKIDYRLRKAHGNRAGTN